MRSQAEIAALLKPVEAAPVVSAPEAPEGPVARLDWRNAEQRGADQRRQHNEREGRAAAARRAVERAAREPVVEMVDRTKDAIYDKKGDDDFEAQNKQINETWEKVEAEDKAKRKLPWKRGGPAERADRRTREEVAAREAVKAAAKAERDKTEAIVNAPDWAEQQREADKRQRAREDQHHVAAVVRQRDPSRPGSLREVESVYNPVVDEELLDLASIDLDAIPTPGVAVERSEPAPATVAAPRPPEGPRTNPAEEARAEERRRATGTPRQPAGPLDPLMEPAPVPAWEPEPAPRTSWRERGTQAAAGARNRLVQAAGAANRARQRLVQAADTARGAMFGRGGGGAQGEAQATPPVPEAVAPPMGGAKGAAAGELRLPETEVRRSAELVRADLGAPLPEEEWPELGPAPVSGETAGPEAYGGAGGWEAPPWARSQPESAPAAEVDPKGVINLRDAVNRLSDVQRTPSDAGLRQLQVLYDRTVPGGILHDIKIPTGDSGEEVSARDYIAQAMQQVRGEGPEAGGGQPK